MVPGANTRPVPRQLIYNGRMRPRVPALIPTTLIRTMATGVALLLLTVSSAGADTPLRIAVAANFREVAEAVARQFERERGIPATISSASTGILASQLQRGAPFDLLLAADRQRPEALHEAGYALDGPECYAVGRLVLLGTTARDWRTALGDARRSLAMANPRSAPYGKAALAVLGREDVADATQRRVVMGANVQQAFQFWHSGAADLALVARSLSPSDGVLIPGAWHAPIAQFALITATSKQPENARAFLAYLLGDATRPLLQARGYEACP